MTAADYMAAIADFTESENCDPVEGVPINPRCIEVARQFNKSVEQAAKDINRHYLDSYRR